MSDFIKMISTFGTLQKVYKERALILNKIFRSRVEQWIVHVM